MSKVRVGLIGVGGIMNAAHIPGYQACENCEITAICDIDPAKLESVGDKLNIPKEHRYLRYEELMDSGVIDVVDIATPDAMHCPIAEAAVARNLPISVEKPMGMNYHEVKSVCDHAAERNLPGMVCFSWHYNPYVRYMREQITSGKLGKLYQVFIRYIKDSGLWEGRRLEWRFDETQSASGVMGDLGSHMFDIARFIGGEFVSVCADAGIFVKERRELHRENMVPVTTWDWCNVLAKMENDLNATFQISRSAQHVSNWMQVEAYGEKGRLNLSFIGSNVTLEMQTESGEVVRITPPDSYKMNQSQAYLNILEGKHDGMEATLENARRCQIALDAAYRSVQENRWVTTEEIEKEG